MPFIYGILILNISVISNKIIDIETKTFAFLGNISYGLYMYHMLADYFLRFSFQKLNITTYYYLPEILYFLILISLTILISSFSYKYIESKFLKLKKY